MSDWFAHESAYVDEGAQIGKGSKIWHFSHVMSKAVIGENCIIGQNVLVSNQVKVGNGCKIQNNVALYEGVELEDFVFCGPSMVFTNVLTPRSEFPRNTSADYHTTLVKRGASIGANATIVCGITLHECAFVAAGAVVTKDVPAYAMVAGVPARIMGWMSAYGDVLDFSKEDTVTDSKGHKYQKKSATEVVRLA
jgi:UDP-2-acetamido-3-amino-2,3-dideoxy-glucuronate N-acetyltransferase